MKKWIFILILLFPISSVYGDTTVSIFGGYHIWSNSGHTFAHSDVRDKEFNRPCGKIAIAHYFNKYFGLYSLFGMDDNINEDLNINGKKSIYSADNLFAGIGIRIRKQFKSSELYFSAGTIYDRLKNKYRDNRTETISGFGPSIQLGGNIFVYKGFFISPQFEYSWNKKPSSVYGQTTFDPGGLRSWIGIGCKF